MESQFPHHNHPIIRRHMEHMMAMNEALARINARKLAAKKDWTKIGSYRPDLA